MSQLWDDPTRDFRHRYQLPDQFIWDSDAWPRIDFDGYTSLVMQLLPKPPARILDVGCGPGLGAQLIKNQGYDVTGVDYNERGIEFARLLVPDVEFVHGDVRLLSEKHDWYNAFDAAVHVEVFEHIPPEFHPKVLTGIHHVLGSGGMLILTVPSVHMPINRWHYKHFRVDEIVELIEQNGFHVSTIVNQHRLGFLMSPSVWRVFSNRYFDLKFARRLIRLAFLRWYNTTSSPNRAGRYIVQAKRI